MKDIAERERRSAPAISEAVRRHLHQHDWPGNVRELQHFAHRVSLRLEDEQPATSPTELDLSLPERTHRFEAEQIREALAQARGDVRSAIGLLGIPRKTFYDKVARYGISLDTYRRALSTRMF